MIKDFSSGSEKEYYVFATSKLAKKYIMLGLILRRTDRIISPIGWNCEPLFDT